MRNTLLCWFLIGLTMPAYSAEWCSHADSEFSFATTIEGAASSGQFQKFLVDLDFDPTIPGEGRLRVTVDLRAADMGDPDMNAVLFDPAWFDVSQFTEAVYESTDLAQASPGQFIATGTLNLKGADKPVNVPFSWTSDGDNATMQGQFLLRRTDFNVGSGEWATDESIGIDVTLTFSIQLERCN